MNDQPQGIEDRIRSRTDLAVAGGAQVSPTLGGIAFRDMAQVMEFSKLMAVAGQAVPKHLRAQPGACLAVTLQALNWRLDPFAVANKSYMVNDRIAYEAQLIHAVVEQRAPIKGRLRCRHEGEGAKRRCIVTAKSAEDGSEIEYTSPEIGTIKTKNSPLWHAEPDQQLWFYSVRAFARRHFPDVILGVYERDEIEHAEPMRDVTPEPSRFAERLRKSEPAVEDVPQEAPADDPFPEPEPEIDNDALDAQIAEKEGLL